MHHTAFGLNRTETVLSAIAPPSTPIGMTSRTTDMPQSLTPRALRIINFCASNTAFETSDTDFEATITDFETANTDSETANTDFGTTITDFGTIITELGAPNTAERPTNTAIATGVMVGRSAVLPAAQSVMPLPLAARLLRLSRRPWQTTEAVAPAAGTRTPGPSLCVHSDRGVEGEGAVAHPGLAAQTNIQQPAISPSLTIQLSKSSKGMPVSTQSASPLLLPRKALSSRSP